MPSTRTPSKWPYRAARPVRSRVIKSEEPRRGVHRRGEQVPAFRITPGQARLAFFGVVGAAAVMAGVWLYQSPFVTVHEIQVTGAQRFSAEEIVRASGLKGASTFRADAASAARRIEALPGIRSATVELHGWTAATIVVEERTPWGSWQIKGVNVPIDDEGYVLDGVQPAEGSPVVIEVNPGRVLNAGDRLDAGAIALAVRLVRESETAFGRRVTALAYRESAGLTAVLSGETVDDDPIWVTFGDSRDYDYKVAALYVLLEQARAQQLDVHAIDLRFGSRLSFN